MAKKTEKEAVTKVTEKNETNIIENKIEHQEQQIPKETTEGELQEEKETDEKDEEQEEFGIQYYDLEILGQKYNYKIKYPFEMTQKGEILYTVELPRGGTEVRRLSHLPVFPTAVIKNLDSGEEKLKIAVKKNGEWKEGIFLKSKVYGTPIDLANFGIPINSSNSRWFVRFLAEFEADNEKEIPIIEAVSKLGWRNGHFVPFSNDCPYEIDIDYRLEKWINAYSSKGTLKEWRDAINPYRKNNLFRFILASSFASVLLEPLGHRIFMVFNWGNSRAGKTAALFAALSAWGNPNNLVMTFNTTAVGVERLAGLYNDLPLALDEKQVNKSQTDLEKIVYMLSSGISRIRGNKTGGVQAMNSWKTVILATGEETISTPNTTTGVQTRCLEIEGSPFDYDEEKASKIYELVGENYGTAGKVFIDAVLEKYSKNDYYILRRELKDIQKKLEQKTSNDIRSYITAVALVVLADMIVDEDVMGDKANQESSINMGLEILENLAKQQDIDIVDKCYEYIKSWILANHNSFDQYNAIAPIGNPNLNPENDLMSRSSSSRSMGLFSNDVYYVHRSVLEDKLKSSGYSYLKIVREFAKRGYITPTTDENGNISENTVQKKYRGRNARMFAFPIAPIEKLDEEERKIAEEEFISLVSTGMMPEQRDKMYAQVEKEINEISSGQDETKIEKSTEDIEFEEQLKQLGIKLN